MGAWAGAASHSRMRMAHPAKDSALKMPLGHFSKNPNPKRLSGPLSGARRHCPVLNFKSDGAVKKTRTSTGFRPQRPQRCASTNSAMTAKSPGSFEAAPWQERATSKGFPTRQVASFNYFRKARFFSFDAEFSAELRGSAAKPTKTRPGRGAGRVMSGRMLPPNPGRIIRASSRFRRRRRPWGCPSGLR